MNENSGAELTLQIYRIVKQRGMTLPEVGKTLGLETAQAAQLTNNRSANLSVKRLVKCLIALAQTGRVGARAVRTIEDALDIADAVASRKEAVRRGAKPLTQLRVELGE